MATNKRSRGNDAKEPPAGRPRSAKRAEADKEFELVDEKITNELDPHLQDVLLLDRANQAQGRAIVSETAAGETVVDVIAKVKDPTQPVPGLRVVRKIGPILTGSVAIADIEAVRQHPNISSLKRATEVRRELSFSVPEIGADAAALRQAVGSNGSVPTGRGVIVGVVDFGLDFRHDNFRKADQSSRVLFLWDQQAPANSMSPAGFGYGREFTQAAINSALNQANPYAALGYQPDAEAHGTHVTDIAAGNGRATGAPGVAPEADIIFVQLHGGDFADDESFGNSKTLLEAVDYIFEKAQQLGRPCVVNLSLGTHGGPHDGSTLAEQGFDVLLDESGRALVIAAGNSSQRGSHAAGTLNPGQSRQLSWQIRNGDATDNELEVWYAGDRALSVTLIAPSGARLGPVQPGNTVSITQQGTPSGSIISRIQDPNNNSNQINIILRSSMPAGTWKVELTNTGTAPAAFDAWIERDDFGQSRFAAADDNRTHTIGSISCGQKTLVVGSYQATVALRDISNFSSSGPTRDGREKPEISAPGDMVRAANSLTQGAIRMSGTSMAAPHVTGLVALIQQAAGRPLSCDEVRALVMSQSRQSPPPGGSWDPRFGMGRIGAPATVLAALPATPAPIEAPIEGQPLVAAYLGQGHENGNAALAFDDLLRQMATVAERAHSKVSIHIAIEPVQAG